MEFRSVGFWGEGKTEVTRENLSEQRREPTTNSTHIRCRVQESNPGHIGGRRVLSLLHHPCFPSCLLYGLKKKNTESFCFSGIIRNQHMSIVTGINTMITQRTLLEFQGIYPMLTQLKQNSTSILLRQ